MVTTYSCKRHWSHYSQKRRGNSKISDRSTEAPVLLLHSSDLVACLLKAGFVTMLGNGLAFVPSTAKVCGSFSRKISTRRKSASLINTVCIYPLVH